MFGNTLLLGSIDRRPNQVWSMLKQALIVTLMMTVALVVIVFSILVMPVGMPVPVVFPVPVALVVLPALRIAVIVRVAPICSRIWRSLVMPRNPSIVVSLGSPEALYPHELWCRRRRGRWLEAYRWRRNADVHRHLRGRRNRQNRRNK
jgi:hypothetical protein